MTFEIFWPLLVAILVPLGIWRVQWAANKAEKGNEERDRQIAALKESMHQLELKIAGDLPTKEDIKEMQQDTEAIRSMLIEVRDMVLRMDERGKTK